MWKKDKRYLASEKPFNENRAESRKVGKLKKGCHHSYASFLVHTSMIENGWINAKCLQELKHNTWVAIPGFVQHGLTQNVKMDHKKKFRRYLQTMQ